MAVAIPIIIILAVAVGTIIVLAANRQRGRHGLALTRDAQRDSSRRRDAGRRGLHVDRARDHRPRARRRHARHLRERARQAQARRRHRSGNRSTRKSSASPAGSSSTAAWSAMVGFSVAGFGAACLGFLWPTGAAGFGGKVSAGKTSDIIDYIQAKSAPFYVPEARAYVVQYPPSRPPRREEGLQPGHLRRHGRGLRRALPALRAPRLPRAVVPVVAVVRVPVPRLEVQPRRREEGRPGAPRPRPLRAHRLRRRR